jgi:hypothetical protein
MKIKLEYCKTYHLLKSIINKHLNIVYYLKTHFVSYNILSLPKFEKKKHCYIFIIVFIKINFDY